MCKKNVPVAKIVPLTTTKKNKTKLGIAKGSAIIHTDLTKPMIPNDNWDILKCR